MTGADRRTLWLEAIALCALAVAVRLPHLEHPPIYDELYHVLTGRSWSTEGTLRIADGEYRRSWMFSAITGSMFSVFGESLTVARVVPLMAGAGLVAALFVWTRAVAGRRAAWIAGLFLCLSPQAIALSQFIRFYTLHALAFFAGAISIYFLVARLGRPGIGTAAWAASAVLSLSFAVHLQITTAIGLAGLFGWAALVLGPKVLCAMRDNPALRWGAAAIAVGGVVLVALAFHSSTMARLWKLYNEQALWAQGMGFRFYHRLFAGSFPTFWSLLPLAALVAFVRKPGPTLFCACIFVVAFSFHSFGGMKAARYVFYATPFLFAIWGMALAELVPVIGQLLREATAQAARFGLPARMGTSVQGMVVLAAGLFLVGSNRAFVESYRILRYGPIDLHPGYSVDWAAASEVLKPIAARSDVVITTNALAAIYYLGDYDFDMNASHLAEADPLRREFTVDHETGRPAISTRRSLERVMACHASGLFVTDRWRWHNARTGIAAQAARFLSDHTVAVGLPKEWNVLAFTWTHNPATPLSECPALRGEPGRHPETEG